MPTKRPTRPEFIDESASAVDTRNEAQRLQRMLRTEQAIYARINKYPERIHAIQTMINEAQAYAFDLRKVEREAYERALEELDK